MATKSYWQRLQRGRVSRRRLLGAAGASAAGLAVAAACGGGGGTESSDGTPVDKGEITKDGIVHLSFSEVLPTMNLYGATALAPNLTWGISVLDHPFYVPLDTQVVEPMLAHSWENPDEQGLETIFHIQDTTFHDKPPVNGRQVLASDVKASYEAYAADNLAPGLEWHHTIMESVEAPDDLTFIIKQNQTYAWLFHPGGAGSLASSNIVPEETINNPDVFNMDRDIIGSGRTMIVDANLDSFFSGARHPGWRIEGEPYVAGWESRFIGDSTARLAAFRAAELDTTALANKLEADQMEAYDDRIEIVSSISRAYHALMLNLERVPDFKNVNVRRAINLAINRQELIQGVELDVEGGVPAGPVPPALAAYELPQEEMDEYFNHDPDEAKQILEEEGFDFDKQITIVFPSGTTGEMQKRAQLLKEQFTAVGMNVKIESQDLLSVWLPQTLMNGDFDMTVYTQLAYDDPHYPMSFYTTHSPLGVPDDQGRKNNMEYYDDEITDAVDEAETTVEPAEIVDKVKDVVRLIMEKQAPMINLYASRAFTARWKWYKGHEPATRGVWAQFNGKVWIDTNMRGS